MPESTAGFPKLAGKVLMVTGILHCLGWIVSGWSGDTGRLIPFGIVYAGLGLALTTGHLRARYPALVVTLIGVIAASVTIDTAAVAEWFTGLLIVIDLVILALLAASLWRRT